MRIQVTRNYRGLSIGSNVIPIGEYAIDDPALHGIGQYLLDNGHAYVIAGQQQVEPVKNTEIAPDTDNMTYHNEMMQRANRPTALPQSERNLMFDEYERLTGNKPPHNIGDETLRQRIAELQADDTPDAND